MSALVRVAVSDGVAHVVIDRPPLNILTRDVLRRLRAECDRLERDTTLRALILAAEGKHFSAGADVQEHLPPEFRDLIPEFVDTVKLLDAFPVPVVAAVQGRCLGGAFELVQAADVIVAAESAKFGQPEIALGVFPPAACVLLPARCGRAVASDLIFGGDLIDAVEAARVGLVQRVVEEADLHRAALDTAARYTRHSAAALRAAKRAMHDARGWSRGDALDRAAVCYVSDLMATHDAGEGLAAFVAKRQPKWSHA
jgi:cyclohexa-1,5-dienecarbonyl-CoA hydratase